MRYNIRAAVPQAEICWDAAAKQLTESQVRGRYIAFSHLRINTYHCFVQKL